MAQLRLVTLERARMLTGDLDAVTLAEDLNEATKPTVYLGRQEQVYRVPAFSPSAACCTAAASREPPPCSASTAPAHGQRQRAAFFSRSAGTPMMVISVGSGEQISRVLPELGALLRRPLLTLEPVTICKRDAERLCAPAALPGTGETGMALWHKLMVYTSAAAQFHGQPIHCGIVRRLRVAGISGATTVRGV